MYALNLMYHSCHLASSPRKTGGFPNLVSRTFVVGCGPAALAAAARVCWSLWTCAVSSTILRWPPRSIHGLRPPYSCLLEQWLCSDLLLTAWRRDSGVQSSPCFTCVQLSPTRDAVSCVPSLAKCLFRETLSPRSLHQRRGVVPTTFGTQDQHTRSATMLTDVFYTNIIS